MAPSADTPLYTAVDDDLYDQLCDLCGQQVAHVAVWEDSLADALGEQAAGTNAQAAEQDSAQADLAAFDIDLYLAGGVYFELYGVSCFDSPSGEPWTGLEAVRQRLGRLAQQGALHEIAVTEDDELVLVLRARGAEYVYLVVGAWLLEEWDELPL